MIDKYLHRLSDKDAHDSRLLAACVCPGAADVQSTTRTAAPLGSHGAVHVSRDQRQCLDAVARHLRRFRVAAHPLTYTGKAIFAQNESNDELTARSISTVFRASRD